MTHSSSPPTSQTQSELVAAAQRLIRIKEAPLSFRGFCHAIFPKFTFAPFHYELIDTLDALENGTLGKRNLLVTMPPRHGKSTITTVAFPAYYMLRQASRKILSVSYGADLAANFGRQVRDLTLEAIVAQAFPSFELSPTSTAIDDWRTTDDGRYFACGVGGGTTGRPANLLLVDDPIKSRPDAESPAIRNKIWQFYTDSLVNRKEPELDGTLPIEILIQTRWHPDDLAGRIQSSSDWSDGDWHHIDFPAIRTTSIPTKKLSSDGQTEETVLVEKEEALWPDRFPISTLDKLRRRDPRGFAALYQQSPYIQGGNLIKTQWFNFVPRSEMPQRFHTLILAADTAFKTKTQNDPSVIMALGLTPTGDIYILDIQRQRLDFPSLKRKFIVENAKWRGKGLRGIYIEDKASGQSIIQELRREPGLSVIPYKFSGHRDASDKIARANSVLTLIEGGRVFMPDEAPWLDEFLDELQSFPASKHDDQVDALVMGLDTLNRIGLSSETSFGSLPNLSNSLNSSLPSALPSINSMFSNPSMSPYPQPNISPDTDIRSASPHQSNWLNFKPLGEL